MTMAAKTPTVFLLASLFLLVGVVSGCATTEDMRPPVASAEERALDFDQIQELISAFVDTAPADLGDDLRVAGVSSKSDQAAALMSLAGEIANGAHGGYDSLLIAHRGELVFESYYRRGRVDLPHPQASTTKAFTNLAIGRAVALGYLTMDDLDRSIESFLKGLNRDDFVVGAETISLHQAMTMRSGIRIDEETLRRLQASPERLAGLGEVKAYLGESAPITALTQVYNYQSSDPRLVMQVLNAIVPGGAEAFIKSELLEKLDIENYQWRTGSSGLPEAPFGSNMTSRDMMKWGLLVQNKGVWNGEQLIPEAYLNRSINRIVYEGVEDLFFVGGPVSNPGYGYYWWQADLAVGDVTYFSVSAQGGGGQYIILIDALGLIVVTTAHDHDVRPLRLTANHILPAFTDQASKRLSTGENALGFLDPGR